MVDQDIEPLQRFFRPAGWLFGGHFCVWLVLKNEREAIWCLKQKKRMKTIQSTM